MNRFALLVRIEAKAGKEEDVEKLLTSAIKYVEQDPNTPVWQVLRFGPATFGLFQAFLTKEARDFQLAGPVSLLFSQNAGHLFARPPHFEKADIMAEKLLLTEPETGGPPLAA